MQAVTTIGLDIMQHTFSASNRRLSLSERKMRLESKRSSRKSGPLHLRCKGDSRVTMSVEQNSTPRILQRSDRDA